MAKERQPPASPTQAFLVSLKPDSPGWAGISGFWLLRLETTFPDYSSVLCQAQREPETKSQKLFLVCCVEKQISFSFFLTANI